MQEESLLPYENIMFEEAKFLIYNFSTLCSLIENKKLNFQKIFALLLTDESYKKVLSEMLNVENDLELFRTVLKIEPSISSSKYISRISKSHAIKR